jgi:flagellar biosynthesis protein FliQ
MESPEVIDLVQQGIYVLMLISAPLMIVSLVVGLAIAILQALTQIQESTLSFVPKMIAMLITLAVAMPFMLDTLIDYTHKLQDKIVHIE